MSVKGDWSRVKNKKNFDTNYDSINWNNRQLKLKKESKKISSELNAENNLAETTLKNTNNN